MDGLRNARSIGCGEQDHGSNGSSDGGGKTGEACAMRPEAMRVGLSLRVAAIQHRIAKWQTGSQEELKLLGAGISGRSDVGKERLKKRSSGLKKNRHKDQDHGGTNEAQFRC
jgi:hypothetical protein